MSPPLRLAALASLTFASGLLAACSGGAPPTADAAVTDAVASDRGAGDVTAVACTGSTICASRSECCSGFSNCTGQGARHCSFGRGASSVVPADLCTAGEDCIGGSCGSTTSSDPTGFRCQVMCLPAGAFCADSASCCGMTCNARGVCG